MAAPGKQLGPYEVIALVGAGGMGEVYRARDKRLQRDVAIKVLPAAFSQDAERLHRFEQEARAAAALNHPNILSVFDIGTENGAPYIVSELLEGESLRERLRTGALPQRKAIEYAIQLAHGLAAAHDKGIVHRDLKPDNIFLTSDGRVKILDFGLAKLIEATPAEPTNAPTIQAPTQAGVLLGTVGYMAPEQVRGKPADHRSDIFAFGAILYEMLAGKRAFHGETTADALSSILKDEPPDLSATNRNISPGLEHIVRHCLEKEPQQRFQSAGDIAFHLGELSGASSTGAAALAPTSRGWNRRMVFATIGTAGLVLTALLAYFAGRNASRPQPARFIQVTYAQGVVNSARFAPDGQTIVCAARWNDGKFELYSGRLDSNGLRPLGVEANLVAAVSASGELAVLQDFQGLSGFAGVGALARVPLGGGAPRRTMDDVQFVDWSREGSALAVVRLDRPRNMYRLEYPAGKLLYETTGWIGNVRFSPDGKTLAFLDHPVFGDDLGSVAIIPAGGGEKKRLGRDWGSTQGLAWTPSGKEVWFSATERGTKKSLYAVTLSGQTRSLISVPGGIQLEDIAPDGRVLVTFSMERRMLMVSSPGHPKEQELAWLDWPYGLDFSADGKQILFGDQSAGAGANYSTYMRGVDGSPAVRLGDGDPIALSPDGRWALSRPPVSPSPFLLLPTGSGEPRQLTHSKVEHIAGRWFPDSKRIAFVGTEAAGHGNRTYILDLDGNEKPLTPEGVTGTLVTPDGKFVVVRGPDRVAKLFPVEGGEPQLLAALLATDFPLRFTPDGRAIYVAERSGVGFKLLRVDMQTGKRELLKELGPPDPVGVRGLSFVAVSPDGSSYGYEYGRYLSTLYVVEGLK